MILITGITGFLGQHLAIKLVQRGENVIGLSRKAASLKIAGTDVSVFSVYDVDLVNLFMSHGVTKVMHCATDYGRGTDAGSELEMVNYILPRKLYILCNDFGCDLFINSESFLQKGNDTGRNSEYISSKNKLRTHLLSEPRVTRYVSLQIEHMYGPNDNPSKLIPHVMKKVLGGSPIIELGNCSLQRDLVYVDDVVSAFLTVLDKYDVIEEELLEVGTGVSVDLKEAVFQLLDILNFTMGHVTSKTDLIFNSKDSDQLYHSVADINALKKYGWSPMVSLASGFEKTVASVAEDVIETL